VAENPRIEELRRRIQKDPASIAFAQLAEEHRRGGQFDEAVRVCRAGLAQHPAYLSARITLGRALLEMGRYDDAACEFEYVLKAAPDNLTAVRELTDINQRRRSVVAPPPLAYKPRPEPGPPAAETAQPASDRPEAVLVELEAWLAVLAEERVARPARV
jgi:tetratricopeptide (TPR) repeat protein